MGSHRFLYGNLITDADQITNSSIRVGMASGAKKVGSGSATLLIDPAFHPEESTEKGDAEVMIEIDSIAAGTEIGQATFKWTYNGTINGTGWPITGDWTTLTMVAGTIFTIKFVAGSGADFALGDKWYFKGVDMFGAERAIDYDLDHRLRTADIGKVTPNLFYVTLDQAELVDAFVLHTHNLTTDAAITIKGLAGAVGTTNGADKILNGGFLLNVDNWTGVDCSLASVAGGASGNCCEMTRTGGTFQYFYQIVAGLTVGKTYRVTAKAKSGTAGDIGIEIGAYEVGTSTLWGSDSLVTEATGFNDLTFDFVALDTSTSLSILKSGSDAGTTLIDSVTLYEMYDWDTPDLSESILWSGAQWGTGSAWDDGTQWVEGNSYQEDKILYYLTSVRTFPFPRADMTLLAWSLVKVIVEIRPLAS